MAVRALVTGATGCVGANTVGVLLARGYDVRAMRRATSSLDALDGLDADLVTGDILDPSSLVAAMEGCELIVHCAAVEQLPEHLIGTSEDVGLVDAADLLDAH